MGAQAQAELSEMVTKMENEREKDIISEHRFHKNIIGAKGEKIREIREKCNQVQVTFPDSSEKSDVVKIRGPKQDVDAASKHFQIPSIVYRPRWQTNPIDHGRMRRSSDQVPSL